MTNILLLLLGGGLGALSRHGMSQLAARLFGAAFPWSTLLVNLIGCFLIGICFALAQRTLSFGPSMRLFFMTGFLGALTTFSTFALESVISAREGMGMIALASILLNNIGGIFLVVAGMWAGRMI